jgi:predicted DCC family thiol-disulfide oxidoreductase YuxK
MNTPALTLLYDAACPICSLEMDHLWERNAQGRLAFVDIADPGFEPAAWGVSLADLQAQIHGVRADGSHLVGLAALREAYAAVGLGWVLSATAWPPVQPMANAAYRVFADHRQRISSAAAPFIRLVRHWRAYRMSRRMARCQTGACATQPQGQAGARS